MSPNYTHPEVLVDTQWLKENLSDRSIPNPITDNSVSHIRVIEAGMTPQAYNTGHIPGAVFWGYSDLNLPDGRLNLDVDAFAQLLSKSGISHYTTVIAHGDIPAVGGFIFWLLKLFGHKDVRVLNGGRKQWIAAGLPLTKEVPNITPTTYQPQTPDSNLRILQEDVRKSINADNQVILDVRSLQEYNGEWFIMAPPTENQSTGHIPNAVHIPYELAHNQDSTFKSVEELRSLYTSKGVTPDKEIIPYCAVGARSAHIWFVLKYLLGYPHTRNYDGSWNQWSQITDAPIEK